MYLSLIHICGPFKGAEGYIKRIRGNRRLVVALEGIIAVATTGNQRRFLFKSHAYRSFL